MTKHQAELMHLIQFPLAAKAVDDASYVDDGVTGADSVVSSCMLFSRRPGSCYVNRTPSEPSVLQLINVILALYVISLIPKFSTQRCWNASQDHFCLTVANLLPLEEVTKRALVPDVARTFDV